MSRAGYSKHLVTDRALRNFPQLQPIEEQSDWTRHTEWDEGERNGDVGKRIAAKVIESKAVEEMQKQEDVKRGGQFRW